VMKTCALVCLFACSNGRERVVAEQPALNLATQVDLARDLDQADHHGSWIDVRRRWQGQHLRWAVTRQRLLCLTADACWVAPFPIERPAKHGWLPRLAFAPGEFDKLAACGAAEQCDVTFEGTLSELVVSAEHPTSMRFTDVSI